MVATGLYIRLGIVETPTFTRLVAENRIEKAPALEVIKRQPKEIILTALARMWRTATELPATEAEWREALTVWQGVARNHRRRLLTLLDVLSEQAVPEPRPPHSTPGRAAGWSWHAGWFAPTIR